MYIRVCKTGSLGPWSRVIMYCSKLSFCQNDSPIGGSFWQKDSLSTLIILNYVYLEIWPSVLYFCSPSMTPRPQRSCFTNSTVDSYSIIDGFLGFTCPDDCTISSQGTCDTLTGTCNCLAGFLGDNCAGIASYITWPK